MRSSSLKLAVEHGVKSPRAYRDSLIHDWFLPEDSREYLENYFQALEYSDELKDHIKNGVFLVGTKEYQITWVHKPETIYSGHIAIMSFRYCRLLKCGYVLIKLFSGEENITDFNFVEYPK